MGYQMISTGRGKLLHEFLISEGDSEGGPYKRKISMFTGIVSGFASIKSVKDEGGFWAISVDLGGFKEGLEIGAECVPRWGLPDSSFRDGNIVHFDIIEETLNRTTLGKIEAGDKVNVERSLKVGDELGGHILSQPYHFTAKIIEKVENEGSVNLLIENGDEVYMTGILRRICCN